jgi:hypothetical protein
MFISLLKEIGFMAAQMICPPYPTEGQSGEMVEPSAGVSNLLPRANCD